jgi:autotransporter-associated beta strand protein
MFTAIPLSGGSGSLVLIDFHVVSANSNIGDLYAITLQSISLNEGEQEAAECDGFVRITNDSVNSFYVVGLQATASGFDAQLSADPVLNLLNLYDGPDATDDVPDVTLVGATVGPISGSIVWNGNDRTMSFVKTGGPLLADTYTVSLFSRADGFVSTIGRLLDGDGDGHSGDDFVQQFTIGASTDRVLSLPDFARGNSQSVNVPATATGLPISISDAAGVVKVGLQLTFDPELFDLTAVVLAAGMPADWTVSADLTVAGQANITASGSTALPTGTRNVVALTAEVPLEAPYGSAQVLRLGAVQLNDGAIAAHGENAFHKVAYFGDTSGSRSYSGLDAAYIARVAVDLNTGFDAYELADPIVIADATGNGSLSSLDASFVARKAIGLTAAMIPDLPGTLPPLVLGGPDPMVRMPTGVIAQPGATLNLPVTIQDATGLLSADLRIDYNTVHLNEANSDIKRGSLAPNWTLIVNADDALGRIRLTMYHTTPLAISDGNLLDVAYHNPPSAPGFTPLDLEGQLNEGQLVLTSVDGDLTFPSEVTWDGGGSTNNWSDAANWSGNIIPVAGSTAIFNGTSTKNAVVDAAFSGALKHLRIDSAYTGTITLTRPLTAGSLVGTGGEIVLPSDALTIGDANVHTSFGGVIGGANGNLTKVGSGSFYLSGNSSYDGATTILDGSILVSTNNALGTATGGTTVSAGAAARLVFERGVNYTTPEPVTINGSGFSGIGALVGVGNSSFAGPVTLASASTIAAYPAGFKFTLSGSINTAGNALTFKGSGNVVVDGAVSGSGNVSMEGAGTLTMSGASTYAGSTMVNAGTLLVTGSIAASPITVKSASILGGTGTVGAVIATGGTVNPGAGHGTLSGSSADFSAGGALVIEIKGYSASGPDFDRLNLSGTLTTGGSSELALDLAGLSGTGTAAGAVLYASVSATFSSVKLLNNPNDYKVCLTYGATSLDVTIQTGACGAWASDGTDAVAAGIPESILAAARALAARARPVTVATLDTGVDYTHPALYRNIWINER